MSNDEILSKTEIVIQGYKKNAPVLFSNLMLNESFISVNHFSFSMRGEEDNATLNAIIDFKKEVLGHEVQIEFKDGGDAVKHRFKGVIQEVNSSLLDEYNYEFQIIGSGLFCTVSKVQEFHSFYKTPLSKIMDKAYEGSKLKKAVKKDIQYTKELHYIVQYNQTLFGFTTAMAMRFGEWMYYDGENLLFGKKPSGEAIDLNAPDDVYNLNMHAQLLLNPKTAVGMDSFKGEFINASKEEKVPDSNLFKAADDAGKKAMETAGNDFLPSGFNQDMIDHTFRIEQQTNYTTSASITGNTRNNKLAIGKIIKIKDKDDSGGKSFIIIKINHSVMQPDQYSNSFTAIPLEAEVPPYSNTDVFPRATPQTAIITDNEDDAGIARVKVRFAWMKEEEKSPWISVLVPHAGKEKGFRFLPEVEDEVAIHFTDNNAELPYVVGALYTEKHKPDIPEAGNDLKIIGSRTGRRFVIDDKAGQLYLQDYNKEDRGNKITLVKTDSEVKTTIGSGPDDSNFSGIDVDGDKGIVIGIRINKEVVLQVVLDKENNCITVESDGDIKLKAKGSISMNASEINLTATNINSKAEQNIAMEGKKEITATGMNIKVAADVNLDMKGNAQANLGGAKLGLKGDGMASLEGALVKIN